MKEYYIERNNNEYNLIAIDETGNETSTAIKKMNYPKDTKYGYELKLPANEMNRCYVSAGIAESIADGTRMKLGDKVQRTSAGTTSTNKTWAFTDYLEPDELATYNNLIKIATERHDKLINDPAYKLQLEIKRLEAKLEAEKQRLLDMQK